MFHAHYTGSFCAYLLTDLKHKRQRCGCLTSARDGSGAGKMLIMRKRIITVLPKGQNSDYVVVSTVYVIYKLKITGHSAASATCSTMGGLSPGASHSAVDGLNLAFFLEAPFHTGPSNTPTGFPGSNVTSPPRCSHGSPST